MINIVNYFEQMCTIGHVWTNLPGSFLPPQPQQGIFARLVNRVFFLLTI